MKYALDLWNVTQHVKQLNRSSQLLAGLALKQNDPKLALSLINNASTYATIRFIQLAAFTQLGDFHNAFHVLHRTIEAYKLNVSSFKPYFGKEMIEDLRKSIEVSGTENELSKFNEIHQDLESLGLINDIVSFQ